MNLVKSHNLYAPLVMLTLCCFPAHASLDGDEIRIEFHYPTLGDVFETETVVVGSGPEVTCSGIGNGSGDMCDVNYGNDFTTSIDVSSDTFSVIWNQRGAFFLGVNDFFNGFVLADLDTGGDITGVSYQCNDVSGSPCIVEVEVGNGDPVLGDYVAINFGTCTPPGDFGSCNPSSFSLTIESSNDNDQDGVLNLSDNCMDVANETQIDTDGDGYGNACDGDFNNDCVVNFIDLAAFSPEFLGTNALFDLNGDGAVNFLDFASLSSMFLSQPGPGLGTCDTNSP